MILAAGRGQRMRPLTDVTPKPLLQVRGKALMQWPMEALARGGFHRLVVNTAWLGEQISDYFGHDPASNGHESLSNLSSLDLRYSHEGRDFGRALETAGGIARALPLLDEVFWVLAGDVFAPDFVFSRESVARFIASDRLAHLWLVPNPAHNPAGDFALSEDGTAHVANDSNTQLPRYTYSTIGLFKKALFTTPWCALAAGNPQGEVAPLAPVLRAAMQHGHISASLYTGRWTDVGTPQRLAELNATVFTAP